MYMGIVHFFVASFKVRNTDFKTASSVGNDNLFLPPKGDRPYSSSALPKTTPGYRTEEETEILHALHSTQSALFLYLQSYLQLMAIYKELSPKSLDVFSCSQSLSRVVSNEFWSSQHRAIAATCLERLLILTGGEVRTCSVILHFASIYATGELIKSILVDRFTNGAY